MRVPQKQSKAVATVEPGLESQDMYIQTHIIYTYTHSCIQLASGVIYRGSSAVAAAVLALHVC